MPAHTALLIGSFDGVHRGHAALVRHACERVGPSPAGRVTALAFDPHPNVILRPDRVPARLTTFDQRAAYLKRCGADEVVRLTPTADLLALSPRQFITEICNLHHPSIIVEGPDFHFGANRSGSPRTLTELGREFGFDVDIVNPIEIDLDDQTIVRASSTLTRWLLAQGRVRDATRILARPYELAGIVVQGDRRGRELGFPTANIDTPCILPADGVYAGFAVIPSGSSHPAAIHVGPRATFNSPQRTLEAHILDWPDPSAHGITQEYNWPITIELTAWIRDQSKCESAQALIEQINRDIDRVRMVTASSASHSHEPQICEVTS